MEEKFCLAAIKNKYNILTPKEKKVADFILKNPEEVSEMTISELSEKAGVVKSLIVRCCKSLGFSGFARLKISLSKEMVRNESFSYIPYIEENDNTENIMKKIFAANIKTLHDTLSSIDAKAVCEAVNLLRNADRIYIYGVGTSAGIVNDFQYRLMRLGYNAICFTDVVTIKVSALNIKKGDVAFGISNSGRTAATVDALKIAREKGAKTICVTSYEKSSITKYSDYNIVISTDEINYPMEAISSRIAHISVLDALCVALSASEYDKAVSREAEIHELINTLRYKR